MSCSPGTQFNPQLQVCVSTALQGGREIEFEFELVSEEFRVWVEVAEAAECGKNRMNLKWGG